MSEEGKKNPLHGNPWTNGKVFDVYESAAAEKKSLEEGQTEIAVKIRRTSENRFLIKTRSTVVQKEATKNSGKKANTSKTRSQRRKEKAEKHRARQEKE